MEKPDPNSTNLDDLALLANWRIVELLEQLRSERNGGLEPRPECDRVVIVCRGGGVE